MIKENFETFYIAKTWKRIVARFLDIVIISLLPILITIIWFYTNNKTIQTWWAIMLIIFLNYFLFFIYFIILPWFWKGMTIAKKILRIRLICVHSTTFLRFWKLVIRELFLVFIPFTFTVLMIILTTISSSISNHESTTQASFWWLTILTRTIASFIIAWYLGIMIVTKIDQNHQLFYDRQSNIYVVDIQPIIKKNVQKNQKNHQLVHVHLNSNLPGVISEEELKNIENLN